MFGIILTLAVTLMHVYVIWRAGSVPFLRRYAGGKPFIAAGAMLWLLFLLGRFYGRNGTGPPAEVLNLAGMTWMAILFLTSVSMLAVDVVTGFGLLLRRWAPVLRGAALVAGLLLSVIAFVQGNRPPVVGRYEVEIAELPPELEGTVIVGLSDLHLGPIREERWLGRCLSLVKAERPDMIVFLGDIFEGRKPRTEAVDELKSLQAPMGVWAVLGNHEFHGQNHGLSDLFGAAGITLLRNETVTIRPGLSLAGVDDLTHARRNGSTTGQIARTIAEHRPGATILLSHTPLEADRAAGAGADLMLCGHTHGGQIWPFGYLVRAVYPLCSGKYNVDGMAVIVSRGAGSWGPPMRLWERGEIIRVTLRARKAKA